MGTASSQGYFPCFKLAIFIVGLLETIYART